MIKVGIIGAGQMGGAIARAFCDKNFPVVIFDINQTQLDMINELFSKKVAEGKLVPNFDLRLSTDLTELSDCELVIECVSEKLDTKKQVLSEISQLIGENSIIATNTSSFLIEELAISVFKPERFIGMHFMNPAHIIPLVELVACRGTATETVCYCQKILNILQKTVVMVDDTPAFILNRLLIPFINEAATLVYNNTANIETVDSVMRIGAGHPMGPLQLADVIGVDTVYMILNSLYSRLHDERYIPCKLFFEYVEKGWLGKKTGRGFYVYEGL